MVGMRILIAALSATLAFPVPAQNVTLSGRLGTKAVFVIDGTPRTLEVGSTAQGVKLISVGPDSAVIEVGGQRMTLRMGDAQVSLGRGAGDGGSSRIVLPASSGGHFLAAGSINGRAVQFMVDTGATAIAISQAQADSIGLKYLEGRRTMAQTANGPTSVYVINLSSVRVGEVQVYDVAAVVTPAPMSHVLLGNSFLSRFQMRRDNDVMTLDKRP